MTKSFASTRGSVYALGTNTMERELPRGWILIKTRLLFSCSMTVALTVHVVLLAVPPQTHGDEAQQDEHHHHQDAAHDQVQQSPGGAGGLGRVGARRGDGVLAGRPRRLTSCSRTGALRTGGCVEFLLSHYFYSPLVSQIMTLLYSLSPPPLKHCILMS